MDARATQARVHHRHALENDRLASQHREQRDALIRRLYEEGGWSYSSLARAVGCTRDLVAKVIRPQDR